jgi:hypothetical protein
MIWPVLAALAATPFTAADLVALNRVSDPQVSPDGRCSGMLSCSTGSMRT